MDDIHLDQIIKDNKQCYEGTEPIHDYSKIYIKQWQKTMHTSYFEGKTKKYYDPYEIFGYGILAYFTLMRWLMVIFAIATIFYIPVMIIYSQGETLNPENIMSGMFSSQYLTLGNLGQDDSKCYH